MGDDQTNKKLGRISIAQWGGPAHNEVMPDINDHTGSPNQKTERAAVLFRAYPRNVKVVQQCIDLLQYQQDHGHQRLANANEFNTDSHFDIWCRAMASMTGTAAEHRDYSPLHRQLFNMCFRWWSCMWFMLTHTTVTALNTPRSNEVIALGGRFRSGQYDNRDKALWLLSGQSRSHVAGKKFWDNAKLRQDTLGLSIMSDMVILGILGDFTSIEPVVAGEYNIDHYQLGHVTHGTGLEDAPGACWVIYQSGDIGSGAVSDIPTALLGKLLSRIALKSVT